RLYHRGRSDGDRDRADRATRSRPRVHSSPCDRRVRRRQRRCRQAVNREPEICRRHLDYGYGNTLCPAPTTLRYSQLKNLTRADRAAVATIGTTRTRQRPVALALWTTAPACCGWDS